MNLRGVLKLLPPLLALSDFGLAQEVRFIGPIRVRDMSPIAALRLDMAPAHGFYASRRGHAFRVNYSLANIYMVSDGVAEYLRERNRDELLDQNDIDALLRRDGDIFFFDGEISAIDLEYIGSISNRIQVQVAWPIILRGGGVLDRFIETFHDSVGLNTANRDLTSRNDFQVITRIGEDAVVLSDRGTHAGLGDPSVSFRHLTVLPGGHYLTSEVAVKLPAGDEARLFSSGEVDYGVQLSLQKQFGDQALYFAANYIWVGDIRVFPHFPLNNSPTITAAWERRHGRRDWMILQGSWSRSTVKGAAPSALTDDRTQVTIGWRRMIAPHVAATVAVTENVIKFKNTPDFGVHLALGWILVRPQR